ncbi:DNA-3-methyladenine glycosylase family protein [Bacillus marinisedimentorum]|uniref:DNA-3-methyladenine glycosylase family protein n=1 Tax=Bacillus marinisedimentorum TaxID=1821260 RepID=UPI000871FC0E|nr:DNA-3-methyladenine glycosylase [Bacillus marinisedimentorum]
MWEETVKPDAPYNFSQALDRMSIDPLLKYDADKRIVHVPVAAGGVPAVITVQSLGDTDSPQFKVSGSDKSLKEDALKQVSAIFQWETPLGPIMDHFQDTELGPLFKAFRGTPLVRDFSLYGCLMKCIIHQQLNMSFAYTLSSRFKKTFGFEIDGVWFYPSPETVKDLPYEALQDLQFSRRKAEYVIDLSKAVYEGSLQLKQLEQMDDETVIKALTAYRGIGPWTAENMLLFGLGRPNLLPKADIGIQNAIKKLYGMEKKPNAAQIEELGSEWEPYLSYASLYLWRSIET